LKEYNANHIGKFPVLILQKESNTNRCNDSKWEKQIKRLVKTIYLIDKHGDCFWIKGKFFSKRFLSKMKGMDQLDKLTDDKFKTEKLKTFFICTEISDTLQI